MASVIVFSEEPPPKYHDREAKHSPEEIEELESKSSTIYVGKLPNREPNTITEANLYSIFSQCGPIKRIIMGLYREDNSQADFCFIEFFYREDALSAIKWMNKSIILGRSITVNIDYGFEEDRQYRRYPKDSDRNRMKPSQRRGRRNNRSHNPE